MPQPINPSVQEREFVRKIGNGVMRFLENQPPISEARAMIFRWDIPNPPPESWAAGSEAYNQLTFEILAAIRYWGELQIGVMYTPMMLAEACFEYLRQYARTVQGLPPVIYARRTPEVTISIVGVAQTEPFDANLSESNKIIEIPGLFG
jgi:hypothetical protein